MLFSIGRNIQHGEHCSIEDSRATMDIFRLVEKKWEHHHSDILQDLLSVAKNPLGDTEQDVEINTSSPFFDDQYWPVDISN